ncbi:riboflavin kinase [Candidatus Peregrinibacteria bacterium]|nr:riboflavin kinase [Candidatus Peregrinibacteria bacterium]
MEIEGMLIKGQGLAKKIGFPTLNIEYYGDISGIFAGEIFLDVKWRMAAVHLGPRPTVDDPKPICEVYVLDWNGEILPGSILTVRTLKKIRDVEKFGSMEELAERIEKDVKEVRKM